MIFKNIILFFFVFTLLQNTEATSLNSCIKIYDNSEFGIQTNILKFFPGLDSEYPLIANIVTGRIAKKAKSNLNKDTWNELTEQIDSCHGKLCVFDLNTKDFIFKGYIEISNNSKLTFVVDFFQLKTINDSGDSVKIDLKKRPNNLNFKFITLVNLIFSSAHRYLENHIEIKTVRLAGSRVVNLSLALALEKAGFKSKTPKITTIAKTIMHSGNLFTSGSLALLAQLSTSKSFHFFMYSIAAAPIGMSASIEKKANDELSRDWILELPVSRDQEDNPTSD